MFGKEVSCKLKGITAVFVVLFHLVFSITDMPIYNMLFHDVGYLCVGIFFFISGYGIALKLNTDRTYLEIYVKEKIPKLLVPYLEIFFIYWIAFKIMRTPDMSVKRVLLSLINGHSIVEYSWYVYAVILFDLCLCLIYKIKNKGKVGIVIFLLLLYWIVIYSLHVGDHWIRSCSTYVFGILCACYPYVTVWLFKHRKIAVILCTAELFCRMIGILPISSQKGGGYPIHILLSWLDCICLVIIIIISNRISKRNKGVLLIGLGKISYELYLIHGLVILMFRNTKWQLNPSWLMIVCTLVMSIVIAYIWHRFNIQVWKRISR